MANPWFRMYHEFSTDPKVQMLSEVDQRRYVMLLCLRCSNDNVTLHETEVAFQLRISNDELTETVARLKDKGLIDDDLKPTSWDKRQFISDSSKSRVAKHRENKKRLCNVTVTKSNALDTDSYTDTNTDIKEKIKEKEPSPPKKEIFKKPTEQEINDYAQAKELNLANFFDYYESNGWRVGKNKMKDWQAAARGWHTRQANFSGNERLASPANDSRPLSARKVI